MKVNALGELFALPLQSAIRAQAMALQETMSALEKLGIEDGEARVFRLKAERTVEEREVDPATGNTRTRLTTQPFEVSIPVLAMLPVAPIQLQEMQVDFGVDVLDVRKERPQAGLGREMTSLASSLSAYTTLGESKPATMKVHMKITRDTSEGMARLRDVLADLISGKPPADLRVERLPRISPAQQAALKDKGISTLAEFLQRTETAPRAAELAKALGATEKEIEFWRSEAQRLLGR